MFFKTILVATMAFVLLAPTAMATVTYDNQLCTKGPEDTSPHNVKTEDCCHEVQTIREPNILVYCDLSHIQYASFSRYCVGYVTEINQFDEGLL